MVRTARREQLLDAACCAFASTGYAATSLEEVATAAGVTRAIVYRHFDTKAALYRAVIVRTRDRLAALVGPPDYDEGIIDALITGAAADPDGFRLLFGRGPIEPEFRAEAADFDAQMRATAAMQIAAIVDDPEWAAWAAGLVPAVTVGAIVAWLDAGTPDPSTVADRVRMAVSGVLEAARLRG